MRSVAATLHFLQNKSFISMATMGEGAGKTLLLRIITADGKLLVAGDDVNSNFLMRDSETVTPLLVSLLTANTRQATLPQVISVLSSQAKLLHQTDCSVPSEENRMK
jgi:hypothetical protein